MKTRRRGLAKGASLKAIIAALFIPLVILQGMSILGGATPVGAQDPPLCERELVEAGVDRAWDITTGRPDVSIAVLDSGMRWHDAAVMSELGSKCRLNEGELPPPKGAALWDANGDGVFNVNDYMGDPVVADANGNGVLDPQDLIWIFSDGMDSDANGYVDDICGWDFLEDDNDPWDETDDGAGAGNLSGASGACPQGMILPVRVGYSALMDLNDFAQGVVFAVDRGAWVIQAGLSSYNNTALGQAALDYAWSRGVAVIAAAGEEQSEARCYPGGCERAVQVNALTASREMGSLGSMPSPDSDLYLGGQTNYGAQTVLSCPSGGESSEAAARTAGIAALAYSAAEDKVRRGEMWRYPGMETPLSASELKQILSMTADDIDYSTDSYAAAFGQLESLIGPSSKFPSTQGWDPYFGYGCVNAYEAVGTVLAGHIPPEAEISSPTWFDLSNPGQVSMDVVGRVAAVRADSYQYTVEYAVGCNPPEEGWVNLYNSSPSFEPLQGVLATLDLGEVYGAIQENQQSLAEEGDPNRNAFTIRVRVRDDQGHWGEDRRTLFCAHDPDAYTGSPVRLAAGVSASPRLADLDDDGSNELIVATQDGFVHALERDFSEVDGWPVHVTPLALHLESAGFSDPMLSGEVYGSVSGTPALGDLDHDGDLEVVVGDSEGRLYAWDKTGRLLPGFPARSNPLYSIPDRADWSASGALPGDWQANLIVPDRVHHLDRWNCLDRAFLEGPSLSNLDNSPDGSLEIIASCQDRHLYAWHMDGTPLAGWPVKLADQSKVAEFNPVTHTCVYTDRESMPGGATVVGAPSVADLDGDCRLEVICGAGEIYMQDGRVSLSSCGLLFWLSTLQPLLGEVFKPASTRVYALYGEGAAHGLAPGAQIPPESFPSQAYLQGWPASMATLAPGVLSKMAEGASGQAAIADVDGDKTAEIGISSPGGPGFLLEPNGTSHLGYGEDGLTLSLRSEFVVETARSKDGPVVCAPAGGCFAELGGQGISYIAPTMGLGRVSDIFLPASQTRSDDQLSAWSSADGGLLSPFPLPMNGMAVSAAPGAADIDGDGVQEILAGNSCYELFCVDASGADKAGWPKFTAGSMAVTPAVGDFDGDGSREVVAATREGWLLVWMTSSGDADPAGWPECGCNPWGTAWLESDARRPARIINLVAETVTEGDNAAGVRLAWTAPGDDGLKGQALCYDIRYLDRPIYEGNWNEAIPLKGKPLPGAAGSAQELIISGLDLGTVDGGTYYFAIQTRDEAGNLSAISNTACASL